MSRGLRAAVLAAALIWGLVGCPAGDEADDDVSGDDDGSDDDGADDDAADDDTADDDDSQPAGAYNGCGNPDGEKGPGSWEEPIEAPYLPFLDRDDTSASSVDSADYYDCAPTYGEQGPEVVYRFVADTPGTLRAEVDCVEPVDVDLHLLQAPVLDGGLVSGCIDRAHIELVVPDLPAGEYWLVADTWSEDGEEFEGPYTVAIEWMSEDVWTDVELVPGIVWSRLVSPDLHGGVQTVNTLLVDPATGVDVQPASHGGYGLVADVVGGLGAVAGINASFFDEYANSLDFMKADGVLLATNAVTGEAQRTLGWTPGQGLDWSWVDAGADWPDVSDGVGGYPNLVTDGSLDVVPDSTSSFFTSRHPRTALGATAAGEVLLVTVDGRTDAGDGMTIDQLAQLMIELGCVDAINLDGGGSTTMVVTDCWTSNLVNFPSDNGAADHHGARSVADGVYLR